MKQALIEFIAQDQGDFEELACASLRHQVGKIAQWRKLVPEVRSPIAPTSLRPFPSRLFKKLPPGDLEGGRVFRTSGTSSGSAGQVGYSAADLELMDVAIETNARRFLFPDLNQGQRMPIYVLAPSPSMKPDMIMAAGMQKLIDLWGTEDSGFLVTKDGMDIPRLLQALGRAQERQQPVTIIGASFGYVHLYDGLTQKGLKFELPQGSRWMDAGGFKGRSRVVARDELEAMVQDVFAIPGNYHTNLLGMTELGSQFYDHVVGQPQGTQGSEGSQKSQKSWGRKVNPPWTRTWAVDPVSFESVSAGEQGVLVHLDLANLDHPSLILTEDVGTVVEGGFEIHGRAEGAAAAGCSLSVDEFLKGVQT